MNDETTNALPAWKYSEPPDAAAEYYANHIQMFWSGVDVTLVFGRLMHSSESIEKNVLEIENRAKVTMPWPVAKLIMKSLADSIARYEEKNGELKLPGEYKPP